MTADAKFSGPVGTAQLSVKAHLSWKPGGVNVYRASSAVRTRVLDLASKAEQPGWWLEFDDLLPNDFDFYLSVEEAAAALSIFETTVIHGLLQTPDYARAWLRAEDPGIRNADLQRYVDVRTTRQRVLEREPNPLVLWAIFDEAVLRRQVGGASVMGPQLKHLLSMSGRANVTIQVLPFAAGEHVGATGSFTLFEFTEPTDPEIVYVDCAAGNLYAEKPQRIRRMKTNFHHLTSAALTPQKSLSFIRQIHKECV